MTELVIQQKSDMGLIYNLVFHGDNHLTMVDSKMLRQGNRHEKRRFCDFRGQISGILHIAGPNCFMLCDICTKSHILKYN
jgi:hypothetical protein